MPSKSSTRFQIPGAPDVELARSPAAATVAVLAEASQLLLAHFEYRVQMSPPEHWLPENRPDLCENSEWSGGVLPESKYQGFRNDLTLGSFHPGHRAKWTAHELCHGLVGFAWRPGASNFYHALAARLSELLPVALFYFFDEAYLRRCPLHEHGGPLFTGFCLECERLAAQGPCDEDPHATRFLKDGRAFVERELLAVTKSIRLGRPVSSPWANLDLMSDGLAYAAAHSARLASPQMERYMFLFFPEGCGHHHDLEALEARVIELLQGICNGSAVAPLRGNQWLWICQDLGWRLLEISCETDGMAARELLQLAERLAARSEEGTVTEVIDAYQALHENYLLPEPGDLFGTGYALPRGLGRSTRLIKLGIESALPGTRELVAASEVVWDALVSKFVVDDIPERLPLGKRFSRWLDKHLPGEVSDLARFEAAVCHTPPTDAASLTLEPYCVDNLWRAAPDIEILSTCPAVLKQVGIDDDSSEAEPYLAMRRDATGEVGIIRISTHLGKALLEMKHNPRTAAQLRLSELDLELLIDWHLVIPHVYDLSRPSLLQGR